MNITDRGLLIVLSGPSGCGKGTVVSEILARSDKYRLSVSLTTRQPRPGEIDGVHYYFVNHGEFENRIENGKMLEYAEYCGNYYGTPADAVERMLSQGINVILEIEMVGAMKVKKACPDAVSILLLPPSFRILEERLRSRGTETDEVIKNRLAKAHEEVGKIDNYDFIVINRDGEITESANAIMGIIDSEKHRTFRNSRIKEEFNK